MIALLDFMKLVKSRLNTHHLGIFASAILFLLLTDTVLAQSPYGWRGPNRDGIYPEQGLLKSWPEDGPELLWETTDAGDGYSSPVITDYFLYITGLNSGKSKEVFSAYSLNGNKVYEVTYGNPSSTSYPSTRSTPTIEGNRAFVISGSGEVVCINITNGTIVWKVDGSDVFNKRTGTWGTAESPLVYDNKVIYSPGGNQTTVVALDAETGETVWKSKAFGNKSSYVSPLLISYNGKRQIVGLTEEKIIGVNPDNGNIEWTFQNWGRNASRSIAPNTPLFKDGQIFICQGYNAGSFKLQLNDDLTKVSELWRNDDLDTHHGGQVLVNGVIFGSNWLNNSSGNWVALDWDTGKTLYEEPWPGGKSKGSIISADNMLYCYDERRGTVGLVNPNPDKFDIISEFRITEGSGAHWAHPVINDGILYIRHGSALMAFNIKE